MTLPFRALSLFFAVIFCSCTNGAPQQTTPAHAIEVDTGQDISIVYIPEPFVPAPSIEPEPVLKNVLVVGDSQACGMSTTLFKLAKKEDIAISQRCKVGSRISYWSKRLPAEKFGAIIVVLGSNDYEQKTSEATIDGFLDAVKERTSRCMWVGPPLIRKKESVVRGMIQSSAIAHRCSYFDSRELALPQPDGVHSTASGYKRWVNESITPFLGVEKLE